MLLVNVSVKEGTMTISPEVTAFLQDLKINHPADYAALMAQNEALKAILERGPAFSDKETLEQIAANSSSVTSKYENGPHATAVQNLNAYGASLKAKITSHVMPLFGTSQNFSPELATIDEMKNVQSATTPAPGATPPATTPTAGDTNAQATTNTPAATNQPATAPQGPLDGLMAKLNEIISQVLEKVVLAFAGMFSGNQNQMVADRDQHSLPPAAGAQTQAGGQTTTQVGGDVKAIGAQHAAPLTAMGVTSPVGVDGNSVSTAPNALGAASKAHTV